MSPEEFDRLALARCTTLSRHRRPLLDDRTSVYDLPLSEFLARPSFPVWFVDRSGTKFVDEALAEASPIRFSDLAEKPDLIREKLDDWAFVDAPLADRIEIVAFHCNGCGRSVVLDGNHRVAKAASSGRTDAVVRVFERSGCDWPKDVHDMRRVCTCRRPGGAR